MDVLRALIDTDERGRPMNLPPLPARAKVEAIFLVLDQSTATGTERRPPPSLAGLEITGDIVAPALAVSEDR
jgi:hypothetical protein